jgi:predicted nucleotidyltransferase
VDLDPAVVLIRESLPGVQAIYVFGSRSRGSARSDSDLDLAVLAPDRLSPEARWALQELLARRLRVDVHLVDLRSATTVMQKQVVATGRVLLGSNEQQRRAFEGHVLSRYARLNEERREILARVAAEGRVHG